MAADESVPVAVAGFVCPAASRSNGETAGPPRRPAIVAAPAISKPTAIHLTVQRRRGAAAKAVLESRSISILLKKVPGVGKKVWAGQPNDRSSVWSASSA